MALEDEQTRETEAPEEETPLTPEEDLSEIRREAQRVRRRRNRIQIAVVSVCALCVFVGGRIRQERRKAEKVPVTDEMLTGTWELVSMDKNPVGPTADSSVLSQTLTVKNNKIQGETQMRASSDAATTAMPFPDESVSHVEAGADGYAVTLKWEGTCRVLPENRIEFQIGKASYKSSVNFDPKTNQLEMDHDAILTFKGPAHYRRNNPVAIGER